MKQSRCVASLAALAALIALAPPAHALGDPAPAPAADAEAEAAPPRDVAGMTCQEIRAESNGLQRRMMAESRTQQQQMMARMQRGRGAGGGMAAASVLGSLGSMIPGVGMFVGQAASMAAREAARARQQQMMSGMDDANAMAMRMMELSQRVQELEMSFSERCDPRMAGPPAPVGGEDAGGSP